MSWYATPVSTVSLILYTLCRTLLTLDVELFAIASKEFVTHCGDRWDRDSVGAESCEGKEEIEDDVQHLDGRVLGVGMYT